MSVKRYAALDFYELREQVSVSDLEQMGEKEMVLATDYDALTARVAEIEKDAARYRWLREFAPQELAVIAWRVPQARNTDSTKTDEAIDAAMNADADGEKP